MNRRPLPEQQHGEISRRPSTPARLRELTEADLDAVAAVHCAAFPRAGLTALGTEAVRRYYHTILTGAYHPRAAVVAELDGRVVGFYCAGHIYAAPSDFTRRHAHYLALRLLVRPWLLLDPFFRERIPVALKLLRWRPRRSVPAGTPEARPYSILSLAVNPACQGSGLGTLLMEDAERRARAEGFPRMALTVSPENQGAIKLYERLGWQRLQQGRRWRGSMFKQL